MKNVMHNSPETEAIRKRMEEVRGDLDTGFQAIVEDARDIGDWTYYLKTYPWAVLGVSLVAGYLIAPRLGFGAKLQGKPPEGASSPSASHEPSLPAQSNVSGKVLSVVGHLVMRGLTAYVVQQADRLLTTREARPGRNDHE